MSRYEEIEIWQGRDDDLWFQVCDEAGVPVDISGDTLLFQAADGLGNTLAIALSSANVGEITLGPDVGELYVHLKGDHTKDLTIPAAANGPYGAGHGPAQIALDFEVIQKIAGTPDKFKQRGQGILLLNATVKPDMTA